MTNKQKIYAGIGSRATPLTVLDTMAKLGRIFAHHKWLLRSGNCKGADQAFQRGANQSNPESVEVFLPWRGYEKTGLVAGNTVHLPTPEAYAIAKRYHPAWHNCSPAAMAFHARNVQIVLGHDLRNPVDLILCWTPKGEVVGGTAMAMRLAAANGISLKNLALESSDVVLQEILRENELVGSNCPSQTEFWW